ncbi:glutamine--fructose-6-phosphate transaminase (isomerizing), partial [Marinobacter alexandrii]
GEYRHFMLKEIYEQPAVIKATMEGRITDTRVLEQALGTDAANLLQDVNHVQIIACGTSYHAGMVARYWIEELAGVPCSVEVASEFRYRKHVIQRDTLFLCISQSGETADTLAALRQAKQAGFRAALAICNVPGSSLVRESDLVIMTQAGPEIGVASTKAFTTQLTALLIFTLALARHNGLTEEREAEIVKAIHQLPGQVDQVLALDAEIAEMSKAFMDKNHSLFLGRGSQFPVALEGALKLKEISYIHAEAYPAGELKHGPLALVDSEMPVVTVAPNNALVEKLKSNLEEVRARGGELFVFADSAANVKAEEGIHVMQLPSVHEITAPIVYTVPLQLLSYHVAVLKGTDVDQPRNLAKSVTVE